MKRNKNEDPPPKWLVPRYHPGVREAFRERERLARKLGPLLERMLEMHDRSKSLDNDPLGFVHQYKDKRDREIVGILASCLAYGNMTVIRKSIRRVLFVLGEHPSKTLERGQPSEIAESLDDFVHRFTRGADIAGLIYSAILMQEEYGSLGKFFYLCLNRANQDIRKAVHNFSGGIRSVDFRPLYGRAEGPSGISYLLPDGRGPGACKRLHMYLRWMVRGPDGADIGIWKDISPSILLMPLDTHTGRICRYLGLCRRKDISWLTAEEVTWNLRGINPGDPVRYDFALAHLGISKNCLHRKDATACGNCSLYGACNIEG